MGHNWRYVWKGCIHIIYIYIYYRHYNRERGRGRQRACREFSQWWTNDGAGVRQRPGRWRCSPSKLRQAYTHLRKVEASSLAGAVVLLKWHPLVLNGRINWQRAHEQGGVERCPGTSKLVTCCFIWTPCQFQYPEALTNTNTLRGPQPAKVFIALHFDPPSGKLNGEASAILL